MNADKPQQPAPDDDPFAGEQLPAVDDLLARDLAALDDALAGLTGEELRRAALSARTDPGGVVRVRRLRAAGSEPPAAALRSGDPDS